MTAVAADWGGGYVTDIAYLPGYYRHQSPLHLNLACLLGGVAGVDIGPDTALSYLELGCGQGFGALMLAACNPHWRVCGVDFNPAHIAASRALAAEAGIANAQFLEADLAIIADSPVWQALPDADVVTLHGLWSWVGDRARAGIVRLLGDKLRPGGIAYVSYNALPGWQGAIGMQRLLLEAGARAGGRSDRQVAAGWELVRALAAANAPHLQGSGFVQSLTRHAEHAPPAYLAHEYLNASWRPCFHADVVEALAAAKLDWVASAQLLENFTSLMLDEAARAAAAGYDDPVMRELIKDLFLTRVLREDVFVRGARRLGNAERDAALAEAMLALSCAEAQFAWEVEVPAGQATFGRDFFGPIVAALAQAPRRVGDLLALPNLPRRDNPGELVGMLVGSHQALPVVGPPAAPDDRVRRLNRAAAKRFVRPGNLDIGMALAASGTGAPLPCAMLDLFIADRLLADPAPDPALWARELGAAQPASEQDRLRAFIDRAVSERAPIWRRLGVLPSAAPAS
ncbi:MAG TPA: class I SAM-dependent methyltransferase [Stellaceae bacterium]|nr:class I SAM-dependent methyltransferase [Stellaceae bacterium]